MPEPRLPAGSTHRARRLATATTGWWLATGAWALGGWLAGGLAPSVTGRGGDGSAAWPAGAPVDVVVVRLLWAAGLIAVVVLAAIHLLAVVAVGCRSVRTLHLADRLSGGIVGRLCAGTVGAGVGLGLLGSSAGAQLGPAVPDLGPRPPELRLLDEVPTGATATALPAGAVTATALPAGAVTATQLPAAEGPTAERIDAAARHVAADGSVTAPTMRLLPGDGSGAADAHAGAPPAGSTALPSATSGPAAVARTPAQAPALLDVWIVRPGDNLWDIAEATLQQRAGVPADLEAVQGYWERLIVANEGNLVDPANADLLFSGQQLTLPPR